MTRFDSPRLVQYGGLAAVGLLAGSCSAARSSSRSRRRSRSRASRRAALARNPEITATLDARA